jgi:hypothetical protein
MLPAGKNITALVRVSDSLGAEAVGRRPGIKVNSTNNGTLVLSSVRAFANISSQLGSQRVDALMGVLRDASAVLSCGHGRPCVRDEEVMPIAGTVLGAVQASVERLALTIARAETLAATLVPLASLPNTQLNYVEGVMTTLVDLIDAVDTQVGLLSPSKPLLPSSASRFFHFHNDRSAVRAAAWATPCWRPQPGRSPQLRPWLRQTDLEQASVAVAVQPQVLHRHQAIRLSARPRRVWRG